MTSDNGMPFPRGKANLYDLGTRVPLAIYWKNLVPGGRVVDDLVSLTDLAPTFLEAAGIRVPRQMTGQSLMDILAPQSQKPKRILRDAIVTARERHSYAREGGRGYPARAIRTHEYLFIRNYEPDRWPVGDPPYFGDVDSWDYGYYSPTKEYMLVHRDESEVRPLFELCFGKRPSEELYDVRVDPFQTVNLLRGRRNADLGSSIDYKTIAEELSNRLEDYLKMTGDARSGIKEPMWDALPLYGDTLRSPRSDLPEAIKQLLPDHDVNRGSSGDKPLD
jgi:hypothetical protein